MTFALILIGLIVVLLTGVPVFAGLMLFSAALLYGVEGHLGRLRTPDLVLFPAAIPRTATNKVKIRELQALLPL